MDRIEVTALLSPTRRERRAQEIQLQQEATARALARQGITLDDTQEEEAFLKALEETLQLNVTALDERFLVLSAPQVDRLAFRLHDALVPKRDIDTGVIQAWTIQPQLQLKVKMSAHIQVLKLSTILREVQCLRVHQPQTLEPEEPMAPRPPIEIEIFPSLRVIEALNTEVEALRNVHFFSRQLRELHIEHTEVAALMQLLMPTERSESSHTSEIVWRKLQKLQINCCSLPEVDESINSLRAVRSLDLGWNQIERFQTAMTTRSLQSLSLCHNQLHQIPPIQALRALRELDLAVNQVASLRGLEVLGALERLDVSHNLLTDIAEVELLTRLTKLQHLKMEFNPVAQRPDYRREVLFFLGEQVDLDGQPWSTAELGSMKSSRALRIVTNDPVRENSDSIWGQPVEIPVYPRARVPAGIESKNLKLVMNYPVLPLTEATVGDYFRTQRDMIVAKVNKSTEEQASTSGTLREDSDESTAEKARTRSRKYTASDFMRDFEEEESLFRGGDAMDDVEVLAARSASQTRMAKLVPACMLKPKDGDLGRYSRLRCQQAREFVESFSIADREKPITISRWLPDLVAVGFSIHSSRAKIVTMKLRQRGCSSVTDAAYQIDAAGTLELLLSSLVARLHQQHKGRVVVCSCANCGALSQFTSEYPARNKEEDDAVLVYSCLLCSSYNVRETSFKKLVAVCASESITIPSSIPLAPPPWELLTEGFYIEEPVATEASSSSGMRECVMVSCHGIREVLGSSDQQLGANAGHEVHSDEWNDAIVHAMTTTR
ncbi:hypothetical protein BBJ28_00013716 [Nothophytophthora sp. Chile5]|nr:hypothetical protein BBJ28_00013716 [Nothophytophthora sp. Chile5]